MATAMSQRLGSTEWNKFEALNALRGQELPQMLGHHVTRLCIVSGLRNHMDFGLSPGIDELCRTPGQEAFARARNAGIIMNDKIPDAQLLQDPTWHPYCIHYPRIASESTYRRLVTTFPQLRYQVGRACAAAGYSQLYSELGLLPDACIAEEARECCTEPAAEGAQRIHERIMAAPTRYHVMNDYKRTIQEDQSRPGACLNADTQVLALLHVRYRMRKRYPAKKYFPWRYFNITEDEGIGENGLDRYIPHTLTDSEAALLDSPLPRDLPTIYKDLLILAAAFEGNVDRYARLRRPGLTVNYELYCLVHGVYKSTALAHWLDRNPDIMRLVHSGLFSYGLPTELRRAIHARRVMNNDVHHIINANPPVPDCELPYWIWWPTLPSPSVLLQLAEERPAMQYQCVRACIAGGYEAEYTIIMDMDSSDSKSLLVDRILLEDARTCPEHTFFEPDMLRRMKEQGTPDAESLPGTSNDRVEDVIPWRVADPSDNEDYSGSLRDSYMSVGCDDSPGIQMYENFPATMGHVRRHLSTPLEVRASMALETARRVRSNEEAWNNFTMGMHGSPDRTMNVEGSDASSWYGFEDGSDAQEAE